jgi:hypothetical protein
LIAAAERYLVAERAQRAAALVAAPDSDFRVDGSRSPLALEWAGSVVATLAQARALTPDIRLDRALDALEAGDRVRVAARLANWLDAQLARYLGPLRDMEAARASPLFAFPAPDPVVFGLGGEDHAWVVRRQTAHPGGTYEDPLVFDVQRVARVPRLFVSCTAPALATIDAIRPRVGSAAFWDGAWLPGARMVEMKTGHDPMISAPEALVGILTGGI